MKSRDIAGHTLGILATVFIALIMVVGSSAVQTWLVHRATGNIKDAINGEIIIGNISIKFLNTIVINDLTILDREPARDIHNKGFEPKDTLFRAGRVAGTFSLRSLFSGKGVSFRRFEIDDAVFNMVAEDTGVWKQNYQRIFRTGIVPEDPVAGPPVFDIGKLRFRNFNFRLVNMVSPVHKYNGIGFDWQNLDLLISELNARDVRLGGRKLILDLTDLTFTDRKGYGPALLKGSFDIGLGDFIIKDFHLTDSGTELNVPDISMSYRNAYSFSDFSRLVHFDNICIGKSKLSGGTLTSILGILPGNSVEADVQDIRADGYVNNLNVSSLRLTESKSGTSIDLSSRIIGLKDTRDVHIDSRINSLNFTTAGLSSLLSSLSPGAGIDLRNIAPGDMLHFSGSATGPVNRLSANGNLSLGNGHFSSKLEIRNLADSSLHTEISGTAEADDFDLGRILNEKAMGECTARAGLNAVFVPGEPSFTIDSLKISRLNALGYDYSGIAAKGKMTGKSFDGKIICNDPNLNFLFQGICNFSTRTQNARYNFFADLGYADLKALNLDKRDVTTSKASCHVDANFLRIVKGDGVGDFKIRDIVLEDDKGEHSIGDITVESYSNADGYRIKFNSGFAEGRYSGTKSIPGLIEDLKGATIRRHIPSLYPSSAEPAGTKSGDYRMDFNFHDSRDLLAFIKPGLYIADSTAFHLDLNGNGDLLATVESPRLALSKNYLKKSSMRFDNSDGRLNASIRNDEIRAADRLIQNTVLTATAQTDSLHLSFLFEGNGQDSGHGLVLADGIFSRDSQDSLEILVRPLESKISTDGSDWNIARSAIRIKGSDIDIDRFRLFNNSQELFIDGALSKVRRDSLGIDVRNLELGMAQGFTETDYGIAGTVNGHAGILSPLGESMLLTIDVLCDSLEIGGHPMGFLAFDGDWDRSNGRLDFNIRDEKDGRFPILADGYIDPDENTLDFRAKLDNLDLAAVNLFTHKFISNPGGQISGEIIAQGKLDAPEVNSTGLKLNDARFKLLATGAEYILNGPLSLNGSRLELKDMNLADNNGGRGVLNGSVVLKNGESPYLDADLLMQGLQLFNLPEGNGDGLYGNLAAAGNVKVKGNLEDMSVSGSVRTSGPGNVHVPLNTATASSNSDLLTFRQIKKEIYIDPYEAMISGDGFTREKHRGNLRLNLNLEALPDVNALLELNKSTGNVITAYGNGNVVLAVETATGKTDLTGDYILRGGNLHFELPGIVKKEFSLKDGSTIKFNGDVKNSTMDISAVYKLKTSLSALLSDSTSVSTRRPVECTINLYDQLRNPQISFGIDVPDLDPNSRTKMAEALNTDDKIQKQFIALLVMGTFLPNEQSGVVDGTNILYSNVGEIMSNQLNNIFQKLNIPLDLGLGYQQNQGGTDIFDVAISTQLFNNRVEIGGTVGNRQYKTSKNPYGDVVGDIDISIKLDKPGQFKLNLFSHSADEFTSFLDYSQRNGIGVTYSKEYNNFWEMLKSIFSSKKAKERMLQETPVEKERKTIRIER